MPPRRGKKGVRADRGEELTVVTFLDPRSLLDFRKYETFTGPDGKRYEFVRQVYYGAALVRRLEIRR